MGATEFRLGLPDGSTSLQLAELEGHPPTAFMVQLRGEGVSATARVPLLEVGGLIQLFEQMAEQWEGWEGELAWSSIEDHLRLRATHDGHGHVVLHIHLLSSHYGGWQLTVPLQLEAGQLDGVAEELKRFFRS